GTDHQAGAAIRPGGGSGLPARVAVPQHRPVGLNGKDDAVAARHELNEALQGVVRHRTAAFRVPPTAYVTSLTAHVPLRRAAGQAEEPMHSPRDRVSGDDLYQTAPACGI